MARKSKIRLPYEAARPRPRIYENAAGEVSAEEVHRVFSVVFHSRFAAAAAATTDEWIAALQANQALRGDGIYTSNQRARASAKPAQAA